MTDDWLEHVTIRLIKEADLPALEWDGEYARYRKVYQEVYRNSQRGISLPYVAETPEDGIIGQVFLTRKDPNPSYSPRSRYFFLSSFRIKPEFRDRGLGDRMIRICFQEESDHLPAALFDQGECVRQPEEMAEDLRRNGIVHLRRKPV